MLAKIFILLCAIVAGLFSMYPIPWLIQHGLYVIFIISVLCADFDETPLIKVIKFKHDTNLYAALGFSVAAGTHLGERVARKLAKLKPNEILEVDINFNNRLSRSFLQEAFGHFPELGISKETSLNRLYIKHAFASYVGMSYQIIEEAYE